MSTDAEWMAKRVIDSVLKGIPGPAWEVARQIAAWHIGEQLKTLASWQDALQELLGDVRATMDDARQTLSELSKEE